jgi:hypothetical protein
MKIHQLLIPLILLSSCSAKHKTQLRYGKFTDERDGHVYKTVKIGKQVWMAENLAYVFNPGPKNARSDEYDHNLENGKLYGRLYNFDAVLQNIAPKGWHVPSDQEWREMEKSIPDPVTALNVLYAGEFGTGRFSSLGTEACFYTSTQDGYPIITRFINKGDNTIHTNKQGIGWELSVRCVKDTDGE